MSYEASEYLTRRAEFTRPDKFKVYIALEDVYSIDNVDGAVVSTVITTVDGEEYHLLDNFYTVIGALYSLTRPKQVEHFTL